MDLAEQASLGIVQSAQERRSLLTVLKIANVGGIVHLVMLLQFALLGPPQAGGERDWPQEGSPTILWVVTRSTPPSGWSRTDCPAKSRCRKRCKLPPSFQLRERGNSSKSKAKAQESRGSLTGESGGQRRC